MELKQTIEDILKSLKERGFSRGKIEQELGLAENSINQNLSRGGTKKMLTSLKLLNSRVLQNATSEGAGVSADDPSPAMNDIAESNRILAEANKTLADAHKIIAKNNQDLIVMMKDIKTNRSRLKTPLTEPSTLAALLELLAEMGTGKKWHSKAEALAEVGNRLFVKTKQNKAKSGTRVDGDRERTVKA
jgi:hypothetical protein